MKNKSIMQQALGSQWEQLSPALKKHYQSGSIIEEGVLDIDYPNLMQPYLHFLRLMGALINQRGEKVPTTVSRKIEGKTEYWERSVRFPDGRIVLIKIPGASPLA